MRTARLYILLLRKNVKKGNISSSVWFMETRDRTVLLEFDAFVCLQVFFSIFLKAFANWGEKFFQCKQ